MEIKSTAEVNDYRYFDPKLLRSTDTYVFIIVIIIHCNWLLQWDVYIMSFIQSPETLLAWLYYWSRQLRLREPELLHKAELTEAVYNFKEKPDSW